MWLLPIKWPVRASYPAFAASTACLIILTAAGTCSASSSVLAAHQPPEVVVIDGAKFGHRWLVSVGRDVGRRGSQRTCVTSGIAGVHGRGGSYFLSSCAALWPNREPILVGVSEGAGRRKVTVFGLGTVPAISRVVLLLSNRRRLSVPVRELVPANKELSGVRRGHFGGVAVGGEVCVEEVIGYSAHGAALYESGPKECVS